MAIIKLPTIYGKGESGLDQQLKIAQGDLMQSKKGLNAVQTALLAAKAGDAIVESKPVNMFVDEVKLRGGQLADWMSGKEQPEHTGKAALERMKDPKASPGTIGGGATKQEAVREYTGALEAKEQMMAGARAGRVAEPEKTMPEKALAALGWMREEGARLNRDADAAGTRARTPAQVARDEEAVYTGKLASKTDPRGLSDFAREALLANADADAVSVLKSTGVSLEELIRRADEPPVSAEDYPGAAAVDLLESIVPGVRRRMDMGASAKDAVGRIAAQRYEDREGGRVGRMRAEQLDVALPTHLRGEEYIAEVNRRDREARASLSIPHRPNEMLLGAVDDMGQLGGYVVENLRKGFTSLLGDEVLAADAIKVIEQTGAAPTAEVLGTVMANKTLPPLGAAPPSPADVMRSDAPGSAKSQVTFDTNVPTDRGIDDIRGVVGGMVGRADRVVQGQRIALPKSAETRTAEVLTIADRLQQQEYMQFPSRDQLEQYTVNQLIGIASSTPLSNEEFAILDYLVSDKAKSEGLSNLFGAKYITEARDLLGKARTGFLSERRESKRLEMARALAKIEKDLGKANRDSTAAQTDWIDTTVKAELTQAKSANEWLEYMANPTNKRSLMRIRLSGGNHPVMAAGLLAGFRYDMPSNSMELAPAIGKLQPAQAKSNGQIKAELTQMAALGGKRGQAAANALNAMAKQYVQQQGALTTAKSIELSNSKITKIKTEIKAARQNASLRAKLAPLEAKLQGLIDARNSLQKKGLKIPGSAWVEGTVGKKLTADETAFQGKIDKLRGQIADLVSGTTATRTGDGTEGRQDPKDKQPGKGDFDE